MELEALPPTDPSDMDPFPGFVSSPQCTPSGASSPLAIHVYSMLAKLHKHTLIPYLPRIMSSVLASLSSSSQLHPACVQVVSALATHTIDSSRDPASNEETLRSLCGPLLSALSSPHPPYLSEGAASCLQSLVESDRWRCAPLDLQELVCAKGLQALMDEGMQTVAHMELMQSLAKLSSCVVIQGYGAPLLAAGMDMLQKSCSTVKRIAAAQLLESILKIADAELLDLDLSPIVGALQECQQDHVAGVRMAATDALKMASSYITSDDTHVPSLSCKNPVKSPASEHPIMPNAGLPISGTPHCGTPFRCGSPFRITPASNKSGKWLKRLPLAPLQQSSTANSNRVAPLRRRPDASKHSEFKENVAPAHNNSRLPASRKVPNRVWTSKRDSSNRDSPFLWSQSASRKNQAENWSLFDSPHTPIVPFHGESEGRDSSVTTLLEKHFGKQRYFFEDEVDVCVGGDSIANVLCSSRIDTAYEEEKNCNCKDMEVCNLFNQGSGERSPAESLGTYMCCGTECLPGKENGSDCRSGVTSDQGSNLQVMVNQALMTPRCLVRTLQFDDEYDSNIDQEKWMESEAGTPDSTSHDMSASDECEEDHYHDDLMIGRASTESNCSSANNGLACEEDALVNLNLEDTSSTARQRVRSVLSLEKEKEGTPAFMYLGTSSFEKDKAIQHHIHALNWHSDTCENHDGSLGLPDGAYNQGNTLDVEPKSVLPSEEKTETSVYTRLWRKLRYICLLAICFGLIFAGFETYIASLDASRMLVPT